MRRANAILYAALVCAVAALVLGAGYKSLMIDDSNECSQTVDFTGVVTIDGTALDSAVLSDYNSHIVNTSNPHVVTAAQIGGGAMVDAINADTETIDFDNLNITSDDLGGENIIGSINAATSGKIDSARLDVVGLGLGDLLAVNNLSDLDSAVAAKANLSLENVENTALSTWTGSTNITTLGTVATGTWSGSVIPVLKGGTGASTAANARTNLGLGNVENTALSTWAGSSNITTLGTVATGAWNATEIGILKGGTGATTAQGARTALLPDQATAADKYLMSNGSDVEWAEVGGGGHAIVDSLDSEYTQRANLKFSDSFSVTDNSGTDTTEIALVDTATTYDSDFVNGNLSAGVLTVTHSLGKKFVSVIVTNNSDEQIIPDKITYSSTSACAVDLSGFGTLTGTWHAFVNTGGTSVSSGGGGEWTLVERQTVTGSATNSVTFSGLDGNADIRYKLIYVVVAGETSGAAWGARPNNDSGSNYSYSQIYANTGSAAASNGTSNTLLYAGSNNTSSGMAMSEQIINATSGVYRMGLSRSITQTSSTAVNYADTTGHMWRNSADNITSIVCSGPSNCYGVGTVIELWKLAE